jgi:excinuclease UvrABC helicase subunit UvrB
MNNSFDDLFNDFLGGDLNNNKKQKKNTKKTDSGIESVIKALTNFSESSSDLELSNSIDDNLGEPSEIRYYEEDGFYFVEQIWETEFGVIKKTLVSDTPLHGEETKIEPTLEEQLEEAVENEDYEKAAKLRDSIKKEKKKKKKL